MANKIVISGPAAVLDLQGNEISDGNTLQTLNGLSEDGLCSDHFDESLETLGIHGGQLQLIFDETVQKLKVVTEYRSERKLSSKQLASLVEFTESQWCDGIGEGGFAEHIGSDDLRVDCHPMNDSYKIAVRQIRDGAQLSAKKPAILKAAEKGTIAELKKCIERGEDVNVENKYGFNSLEQAVFAGNVDVALYLLDHGANIHPREAGKNTALHMACTKGFLDVVERLVAKGADLETRDDNGMSALMWAAHSGHEQVVEYLLDSGADINAQQDGNRRTVLNFSRDGSAVPELLLKRGADPKISTVYGKNAYEVAIYDGEVEKIDLIGRYLQQ